MQRNIPRVAVLVIATWLVGIGTACSSRGATSDPGHSTGATSGGGTSGSGPAGSGGAAVADAVRARICAAEPCGGAMSSITVYRDAGGAVKKLYRLYGRCSHNPGIYFDPDGTQTEIIPEKPIVPGSAEANEIQAKHDKQVGGLTKSESISCR